MLNGRPTSGSDGGNASGFTLLELLATLVLISLATLLSLANVSLLTDRCRLDGFASEFKSFDAHARLRARSEGSLRVLWDPVARRFLALPIDGGSEALRLAMPDDVMVVVEMSDSESRSRSRSTDPSVAYLIDRDGRSRDATFAFELGQETRFALVNGTTGAIRIRRESAP